MKRRAFLASTGTGVALLAGCQAQPVDTGNGSNENGTGGSGDTGNATNGTTTGQSESGRTLRVGTYSSYVDAPSSSPGGWVKENFESEYDATLEWFAPDGGINYFIQRAQRGLDPDADAFLGLTIEDLVRVDRALGNRGNGTGTNADNASESTSGDALFTPAETGAIGNYDALKPRLGFGEERRVVPIGTSYVSLVYNETEIDAPSTFDDLLSDAYRDSLLVENPTQGATGLRFLLQTIDARSTDGYLGYWSELLDNGAQVLGSWDDSYAAYSNGEAPMVVSYSTDQVFANQSGEDLSRHQIAFLDNAALPYTDGIATFRRASNPGLASDLMDFMLTPRVQARTAVLNVGLPSVTNATLPNDFAQFVSAPERTIDFSYDRLRSNLQGWLDEWSRQVAG
jgi:thiamine transport system substrate-binding protein